MLHEITPVLLTFDEENNIGRTLAPLQWARRIVVVDSGSRDQTRAILSSYPNVSVFERPFDNHAAQWNYALNATAISSPWVLALDADHVLSPELVRELGRLTPADEVHGYRARFRYCIRGRPLRSSLYPARTVLFRRDGAGYEQDGHTQRLKLHGAVSDLSGFVCHDDRKPFTRWYRSQLRYAQLEADKLLRQTGSAASWRDRARRSGLAPFVVAPYCLLRKGLLLDGWSGLEYAFQRVIAEALIVRAVLWPRSREVDRG